MVLTTMYYMAEKIDSIHKYNLGSADGVALSSCKAFKASLFTVVFYGFREIQGCD